MGYRHDVIIETFNTVTQEYGMVRDTFIKSPLHWVIRKTLKKIAEIEAQPNMIVDAARIERPRLDEVVWRWGRPE
jgi:hypothetical protein